MEHLLKIPCTSMPFVCEADYSVTLTPMIHVDRTAPFHVAIYLLQGSMEIIEDGISYRIMPDQIFFLKSGVHHWGRNLLKQDHPGITRIFIVMLPHPVWRSFQEGFIMMKRYA